MSTKWFTVGGNTMSTSRDDCQDIERERTRDEREDEIRQRLLGPIGLRPQYTARSSLHQLVLECIARAATTLVENDHFNTTTREWVVDSDDLDHLAELLADLGDIEKEGW